LFPTIDRVKKGACGIQLCRNLLSLPEVDFLLTTLNLSNNLQIRARDIFALYSVWKVLHIEIENSCFSGHRSKC
jgi:hypothetical protein